MKLNILLITLLLTVGCQTQKENEIQRSGWQLVYKHDKQGKQLFGSKNKVLEAVRNGLSLKVGYGNSRNENRSIEHIAEAQFLSILKVNSTLEVFAQISPIMRQGPFKLNDTIGIKLEPGYKWLTAIGTNGMSSNVMVNTFKDSIDGSNEKRRAAMWFVDYPEDFESVNKSLVN